MWTSSRGRPVRSPHEVEVKTADKTLLLSANASSSTPAAKPSSRPLKASAKTRESTPAPPCWSWKTCPAVWSSSAAGISLEFASFYAEFGSRVTILERGSRFLPAKTPMWPTASARRWKTRV
ncbi:MAG: NAD-binding protein [Bilophila wadsworthia]